MKHLTQIFLCLILIFGANAVLAQEDESQLMEQQSAVNEPASHDDMSSNFTSGVGGDIHIQPGSSDLVPVMGIVFAFGTPIAIVGMIVLGWYHRQKRRMQLMEKIVESGQPIPEALLTNEISHQTPGSSLKRGVTSLGLGAGLVIFGSFINTIVMAIGAIPMCMGLAYLLLWKLEDKSGEDAR